MALTAWRPRSVVEADLCARGLERLRVADAFDYAPLQVSASGKAICTQGGKFAFKPTGTAAVGIGLLARTWDVTRAGRRRPRIVWFHLNYASRVGGVDGY